MITMLKTHVKSPFAHDSAGWSLRVKGLRVTTCSCVSEKKAQAPGARRPVPNRGFEASACGPHRGKTNTAAPRLGGEATQARHGCGHAEFGASPKKKETKKRKAPLGHHRSEEGHRQRQTTKFAQIQRQEATQRTPPSEKAELVKFSRSMLLSSCVGPRLACLLEESSPVARPTAPAPPLPSS